MKKVGDEIQAAERVLAEQKSNARTKLAQEAEKHREWYEAAAKLDKMLSSGSTSTSQ